MLFRSELGTKRHGFKYILLPENGRIPVEDKSFDIVHCSSVIEHVTVEKKDLYSYKTWKDFKKVAFQSQKRFANEIRRIAKDYFVQTPNKYFFLESHTLLPLMNFLPRKTLIFLIPFLNRCWIKKTAGDWNLLSQKELKILFPEAKIIFGAETVSQIKENVKCWNSNLPQTVIKGLHQAFRAVDEKILNPALWPE